MELEEGELEDDADSGEEEEDDQDSEGETYLKPPKDPCVLTGGLRCSDAYPRTLGRQVRILYLRVL